MQCLPDRARVIFILAAVLGIASANLAALGALAHALEGTLRISDTRFGLVGTVASLSGAVLTLIAGVWVDRRNRVHLLAIFAAVWAGGMAASGLISGYLELLLAQVFVGASGISVGAVVASLTGDYFPPSQRGRIFGLIVGGELVGAGLGMLVASLVGNLLGWRFAFWSLALLGALGVWVIRHYLREPQRSGMGKLAQGSASATPTRPTPGHRKVAELIHSLDIQPFSHRVLHEDPTGWSWWRAARYIVTIRTNIILVLGSSASYFYFTGLLVFADLYLMQRFDLPSDTASVLFMALGSGGVLGVLVSGWLADRLLHRHIVAARVWVAAGAFFLTVLAFLPAFLLTSVWVAAPCFFLGCAVSWCDQSDPGCGAPGYHAFPPLGAGRECAELGSLHAGRPRTADDWLVGRSTAGPFLGWRAGLGTRLFDFTGLAALGGDRHDLCRLYLSSGCGNGISLRACPHGIDSGDRHGYGASPGRNQN
nr:MFS transporter [Acidithiobacillus sp. S30A2]